MPRLYDVVIVGTGHAGAHAAIALRRLGYRGSIGLCGEERLLPYERPPLSKSYLSGAKDWERLQLRPESYWREQEIDVLPQTRVNAVDPAAHEVDAGGAPLGYRKLIWAAGGHPRRLSCQGADLHGVHYIKTVDDVDRLRVDLLPSHRVVIIGGGYIGLETAATLSKLGKHVTVLEAQDRVLARVAGATLSRFFEQTHRTHGVKVHLGASVIAIEETDGRASGVRLNGGESFGADLVIVGIGIVPQVEPMRAAGATVRDGVLVDAQLRTTLPDVFCIGDCALHFNRYAMDGRVPVRLESIQNATDQATAVAKVIAAGSAVDEALPWFWSEQYDIRLQTAGISSGFDDYVIRGDPDGAAFSVIYLRETRVVALDCVNASRDFVQGRALIVNRIVASRDALGDVTRSLKEQLN